MLLSFILPSHALYYCLFIPSFWPLHSPLNVSSCSNVLCIQPPALSPLLFYVPPSHIHTNTLTLIPVTHLYMFLCVQGCMCSREPEDNLSPAPGSLSTFTLWQSFSLPAAQKYMVGICGKESNQRKETWGIMKDYDEGTNYNGIFNILFHFLRQTQ